MSGGPGRIAHVVQAVKKGHEVVAHTRIRFCGRHIERDAIRDSSRFGLAARLLDGSIVVIETIEPRFGVSLGHQDGGRPMAAADIGHFGAAAELRLNAFERWNPGGGQIGQITRTEESLAAFEQPFFVFVPTETLTSPEDLGELLFILHAGCEHMIKTRQVDGRVIERKRESLFGRQ